MADRHWFENMQLVQRLGDKLFYEFDFTQWLEGDTISAALAESENCDVAISAETTTSVTIFVQDQIANANAAIVISTAAGQMARFTMVFAV